MNVRQKMNQPLPAQPRESTRTPFLQLAAIGLLLLLAPYAMTFQPTAGADATSAIRVLLIFIGLASAILTSIHFVAALRFHSGIAPTVVRASAMLAAFAIGWRCFPYWVTGVYQMDLGAAPWMDMDPKHLMPMIWIGEIWRLGVFLAGFVTIVGTPILLGLSAWAAWKGQRAQFGFTIAFCAIAVCFLFLFQHDYVAWILD